MRITAVLIPATLCLAGIAGAAPAEEARITANTGGGLDFTGDAAG